MDPRIRKHSLEAAARVVLSITSLGGCGGKVMAVEDGGSPGDWTTIEEEAAIVDAGVDRYEAGLCGSPPLGVNAIASEATATCCENHLRAAADGSVGPSNALIALPGAPECCQAILSYCEGPGLKRACQFYDVVSFTCCPLFPSAQVSFCGPWGPPTPPAMPRGVAGWLA